MDRNASSGVDFAEDWVALRKESVDRNYRRFRAINNTQIVALRKESVDRNCEGVSLLRKITMSLSARRAWIEIAVIASARLASGSLSARRAWIEIIMFVNLRVVDGCRSPQGERG